MRRVETGRCPESVIWLGEWADLGPWGAQRLLGQRIKAGRGQVAGNFHECDSHRDLYL
jgi:hypothetical protein